MGKTMIKTRKKYGNQRNFIQISIYGKCWFTNGIHSLLRRDDARGSADIIYRMWGISLLCRSGTEHL